MARGQSAPMGASADQLRGVVNSSLGDANIQKRGLGFGKVAHGEDVGSHDAVYAVFKTSVAAGSVYDVEHTLGRPPGFAILVSSENVSTPASHYSVIPWQKEKWTKSSVRVRVAAVAGSLDGGVLTLMLGGE